MYFFVIPNILKKFYKKDIVWEMDSSEKRIWLTFDDGPEPEVTPFVLDELKKYNAKATFFCLGKNVETYPETYQMILNAGHSTGNHSYSHKNGWVTNKQEYVNDVEKCRLLVKSSLYRPPYGKIKPSQLNHLRKEYSIIMWSLISGDFDKELKKEKCLDILLKNTKKGSIVVFHDSLKAKEKLKYVLPKFLEHFSGKGYSFHSISFQVK